MMTDNEYQTITLERVERVAVLTLNRPDALNALNAALMAETVAALTELDRDPNVGAIVITGSDKAFAAGADIKEIAPKTYMDVYLNDWFAAWDRLANVRTPMIAAVAGYALGAVQPARRPCHHSKCRREAPAVAATSSSSLR
jgi:enoyl-CoA hydratase